MLVDLLRIVGLTAAVLVTVIAFGATIKPASDGLLDAGQTAKFLGLAMIPMLQFALPFAAGFGATLSFYRMTADNEVQAMAVSGISYWRILLPVVALGVALTILMVVLTQWIIPRFWSVIEDMINVDITKIFETSIARHEPFKQGNLQIYAEDITPIDSPLGRDGPQTRMVLSKVAAANLNDDGSIITDFTSSRAVADVYHREGRTFIKLVMADAVAFKPESGTLGDFGRAIKTIEAPSVFNDKPKAMTREQLLALRSNPDTYAQVIEAKKALAQAMRDAEARATIDSQLRNDGRVELLAERIGEAGDHRTYVINADRLREAQFLSHDGSRIEIVEYEGAGAVRKFIGDPVRLLPGSEGTDSSLFDLYIGNHEVTDLRQGGSPNQMGTLTLPNLAVAGQSDEDLSLLPSAQLLAKAATIHGGPERVKSKAEKLVNEIRSLGREISARLLNRYALSATAFLLLMLGATLAMWQRGTLPLTTYVWAFLPSILDLILISAGEQLLRDGRILGHITMWSGNALMLAVIAITYARLSRH